MLRLLRRTPIRFATLEAFTNLHQVLECADSPAPPAALVRARPAYPGRRSETIEGSAAVLAAAALDKSRSSFSRQKRDQDS